MKLTLRKNLILCFAMLAASSVVASEHNPFKKPVIANIEAKPKVKLNAKINPTKSEPKQPAFTIKSTYQYRGSINGVRLYYDTATGVYVKDTSQIKTVTGGKESALESELNKIKF